MGPRAGNYELKSLAFNQGHDNFGEFTLAKVVSAGNPMSRYAYRRSSHPARRS